MEEFNRLEDLEDKMFMQYISNVTIKAKIKELENKMYQLKDITYISKSELICRAEIDLLQELLEE